MTLRLIFVAKRKRRTRSPNVRRIFRRKRGKIVVDARRSVMNFPRQSRKLSSKRLILWSVPSHQPLSRSIGFAPHTAWDCRRFFYFFLFLLRGLRKKFRCTAGE